MKKRSQKFLLVALLILSIIVFYICNKEILSVNNYNSSAQDKILTTISQDTTAPSLKSIEAEVRGTENSTLATINDTIFIMVTFSEVVSYSEAPELKIQFGEGAIRTAECEGLPEDEGGEEQGYILYTYETESGDNGTLSIASFIGTVYDNAGNNLNINISGTNCSGTTYACTPIQCAGATTENCTNCEGDGIVSSSSTCTTCGGNDSISCTVCGGDGNVTVANSATCTTCGGSGVRAVANSATCSKCSGTGEVSSGSSSCTSCVGTGTVSCSGSVSSTLNYRYL